MNESPLTVVVVVLDAPARMMTMNWERGTSNRWAIAKETDLWRRAAAERAGELNLPTFAWVTVQATPYQRRGVLADVLAHAPCVKATIDGLVDAGVLPNDRGAEVRSIEMLPPQRGPNGLRLTLCGQVAAGVPGTQGN
jgi:hypothetical protein